MADKINYSKVVIKINDTDHKDIATNSIENNVFLTRCSTSDALKMLGVENNHSNYAKLSNEVNVSNKLLLIRYNTSDVLGLLKFKI